MMTFFQDNLDPRSFLTYLPVQALIGNLPSSLSKTLGHQELFEFSRSRRDRDVKVCNRLRLVMVFRFM